MTCSDTKASPVFTAIILCGGRSSRMGCDKAFLQLDGKSLLTHQINRVRSCQPAGILISGRRDTDYSAFDVPVVHDTMTNCGPLGGFMAAAAAVARTSLMFILAVDMPDVTTELITGLLEHCTPTRGAVYHNGDCYEPLCAFYPVTMLDTAKANAARGEYSLQPLVRLGVQNGMLHRCTLPPDKAHLLRSRNYQ